MSEYVTKSAPLKCTGGAAPSQLQVTSNTFFSIRGDMVATTNDKVPTVNIMPFGTCSLKPSTSGFLPCVPVPAVWTGFVSSVRVPSGNPLPNTSTIQCATGGCISFQNSGRMKPQKVVINPSSPHIDSLKRAAKESVPFCEDSEKKKRENSEKKKPEEKPKILRIYWLDERSESDELSEPEEGREVTLCVETEEGGAGTTGDVLAEAGDDRVFEDGGTKRIYSGLTVDDDDTAYADNFSIKYKET